jgi:carbonic anhydrase
VACCDPRCDPIDFVKRGDELVLCNVGGLVAPLVDHIVALDGVYNFDQFAIIHHNNCGASHFKNEQIRDIVKLRDPSQNVEAIDLGAFSK